jgi:type II secretory pathway pseudopilin PulG
MRKMSEKKNKGFTLVEALVAISILMVAIVSPMTIAQRGLSSAIFSKEQMVASYLAQDAIEYIKNQRDVVALGLASDDTTTPWLPQNFIDECFDKYCDIDTSTGAVKTLNGKLKVQVIDDKFVFYGHTGGSDSAFERGIIMKETGPDEVLVTVDVAWKTDEKVSVSAYIYNYWGNTQSLP